MAITHERNRFSRDKLEFEKEKVPGRKKFPSDVNQELDALEKELTGYGYDPEFSAEILRQIAESLVRCDGNDRLRLRFARSIIKGVTSGNQFEMLLVVQMIGVHGATMTLTALVNASKDPDYIESYGNVCNKFARTYVASNGVCCTDAVQAPSQSSWFPSAKVVRRRSVMSPKAPEKKTKPPSRSPRPL